MIYATLDERPIHDAPPSRLQFSLRSLFVATTTLALGIGMSTWMIRDAQQRQTSFELSGWLAAAIIPLNIVVNVLVYRVLRLRADRKLVQLYRRPNNWGWAVQIVLFIGGTLTYYFATLQWAPHPSFAALSTTVLLWMYTVNGFIDAILAHPYSFHANGIVGSMTMGWYWQSWKSLKTSSWTRDASGNLIIGRGLSRQVIAAAPHQREQVDAIIKEKLGEIPGLNRLLFEQAISEAKNVE